MNNIPSTTSPSAQTRKPLINDISHRGHKLAQIVDRLSPGTYHIKVTKNELRALDWNIEIVRDSELIQRVSLSNKSYVAE